MNETTEKLVRELAEKLGTTTEHLWGVLIRQAYIQGVTDIVIAITLVAATTYIGRYVGKKTKWGGDIKHYPEWCDEGAIIAWLTVFSMGLFAAFIVLQALSASVPALLNPEYWALKQLIR